MTDTTNETQVEVAQDKLTAEETREYLTDLEWEECEECCGTGCQKCDGEGVRWEAVYHG